MIQTSCRGVTADAAREDSWTERQQQQQQQQNKKKKMAEGWHARGRTVQPASEAMGPNFLLIEPPALKRAMSTLLKLHTHAHGKQ